MKEYTTQSFAAEIPCSTGTIAKWRKESTDGSKPLLAPDHFNKRGYPVYTEEQLPAARALLEARKSSRRIKAVEK